MSYCVFFQLFQVVGKYIVACKEYILLFRLIIYILYSFTHSFSTFYIGLLFTHHGWIFYLLGVMRIGMRNIMPRAAFELILHDILQLAYY